MKYNIRIVRYSKALLAAGLILCFSVSGCSQSPKPATAPRQLPPANVKVVKAALASIVLNVEYPSQLKPVQEISVTSEIGGRVTSVNVDTGTRVEKGQVLFNIDDKDIQIQLKQQQASREYYRVNLEKTKDATVNQQILTAEQTLNKAQSTYNDARKNYENNQALYESKAISLKDLNDTKNKYENAAADLNAARDNLEMLKEKIGPQSIDAAYAQLAQADSAVESAATKLNNTAVRAPISGIVATRTISSGEVVSTATQAFTIIDTSSLIAEVSVPYKMTQNIQPGQPLSIKLETNDNKSVDAVVDSVSPSPDKSSQLYVIRIRVDNKDYSVKPGILARVSVPAEKKENVLTVPNQAVKVENGAKYIYVVEEGVIRKKNVIVGLANDKLTEVTNVLKEGDSVIIEGQLFLNDGQRANMANESGGNKNQGTPDQKSGNAPGNKAPAPDQKPGGTPGAKAPTSDKKP